MKRATKERKRRAKNAAQKERVAEKKRRAEYERSSREYRAREEARIAALPPEVKSLQGVAGKCWTYLNVHYPWFPSKYGDKQLVVSDDGFIQVRLEVLDPVPGGFTQFRLLDTCTPEDRAPAPQGLGHVNAPVVGYGYEHRIRRALHLPPKASNERWGTFEETKELLGQLLNREQLMEVIGGRVAEANAVVGKV